MNNEDNTKAKKAAGWVTGLLTGWGIPGTIARILAGAIIGAIATAAALTGTAGSTNDPSSPIGYAEAGEARSTNSHHAAHAGGEISQSTIVNGKL